MKRKDAIFAVISPRFLGSGCINISVPRAGGLISMTLSQPNKTTFLTKHASVRLLNAPEKEKDVLQMNNAAAPIDFS